MSVLLKNPGMKEIRLASISWKIQKDGGIGSTIFFVDLNWCPGFWTSTLWQFYIYVTILQINWLQSLVRWSQDRRSSMPRSCLPSSIMREDLSFSFCNTPLKFWNLKQPAGFILYCLLAWWYKLHLWFCCDKCVQNMYMNSFIWPVI